MNERVVVLINSWQKKHVFLKISSGAQVTMVIKLLITDLKFQFFPPVFGDTVIVKTSFSFSR